MSGHKLPPKVLPVDLLVEAGRALYGDEWIGPLAKACNNMNPNTMGRFANGRRPIPASLGRTLATLLSDEATRLEVLRAKLLDIATGEPS